MVRPCSVKQSVFFGGTAFAVCFISVVKRSVATFECVSHPAPNEERTIATMPYARCDDDNHDAVQPGAIAFLCLYVIGFLALACWSSYRVPSKSASGSDDPLKFVYIHFRAAVYWWSPVVLSRDVALCMCVVFFPTSGTSQILFSCLVVCLYLVATSQWRPYPNTTQNSMDRATYAILLCQLASLVIFSRDPASMDNVAGASWYTALLGVAGLAVPFVYSSTAILVTFSARARACVSMTSRESVEATLSRYENMADFPIDGDLMRTMLERREFDGVVLAELEHTMTVLAVRCTNWREFAAPGASLGRVGTAIGERHDSMTMDIFSRATAQAGKAQAGRRTPPTPRTPRTPDTPNTPNTPAGRSPFRRMNSMGLRDSQGTRSTLGSSSRSTGSSPFRRMDSSGLRRSLGFRRTDTDLDRSLGSSPFRRAGTSDFDWGTRGDWDEDSLPRRSLGEASGQRRGSLQLSADLAAARAEVEALEAEAAARQEGECYTV